MAKAKLAELTEKWIDGKKEKQNSIKTEGQQDGIEKIKQTLYLSKEATKLLWYHRAESGQSVSHTVEQLIMEHIGRNKSQGGKR